MKDLPLNDKLNKAAAIFKELNVEPNDMLYNEYDNGSDLSGMMEPDVKLFMRVGHWRHEGKIEAMLIYVPESKIPSRMPNIVIDSIKFSAAKDTSVCVRDLKRRLLDVEANTDSIRVHRETIASDIEYQKGKVATRNLLIQAGCTDRGDQDSLSLTIPGEAYVWSLTTNYNGSTISIDLRSLPVDTGLKIIQLLRGESV